MRVLVLALAAVVATAAAAAPPLPRPAGGEPVTVLARGVPLPASFAFGKGTVFVAAVGSEDGKTPGGVFALSGGQPRKVVDGAFLGIAWDAGTLYAARFSWKTPGTTLLALSGWNGHAFARRKVVLRNQASFSGMAFGPDGRLYVAGGTDCDHCEMRKPLASSVFSLRRDGTDIRTVARRMRNPFGLAFAKGVPQPFVTVEGQENLGKRQPPT